MIRATYIKCCLKLILDGTYSKIFSGKVYRKRKRKLREVSFGLIVVMTRGSSPLRKTPVDEIGFNVDEEDGRGIIYAWSEKLNYTSIHFLLYPIHHLFII